MVHMVLELEDSTSVKSTAHYWPQSQASSIQFISSQPFLSHPFQCYPSISLTKEKNEAHNLISLIWTFSVQ
jgi:hypothetical protein